MSLINDALKKAARQRAEEQGEVMPPMPGSRGPSRQAGPVKKQTMVLVIGAAVALVVVSAVVTGILMTGKPEAKPPIEAKTATQAPAREAAATVALQAPAIAVSLPPTPVPTAASVVAIPLVVAPPAAAKPAPTAAPVAVAAQPAAPEPRTADSSQGASDTVQAVVDAFNVSGVRTAGTGSKAIINGHIFKLNELVDKKIGLKLTKVDEDHLTFVDRDGNTFVKTF